MCPSSSSVRTRGKVLGYSGIELLVNEFHVSSGENAVSGVTGITNVDAAGDGSINDKGNVVVDLEEHSGFDTVKGRFDVNLKGKFDVGAKEKLWNDVEGSCGVLIKRNIDVNVEGNVSYDFKGFEDVDSGENMDVDGIEDVFIKGNISTAVKQNVNAVTEGKGEFHWTENGVKTEESSYAVANQNLDTRRNVSADVTGYEVDASVKKMF